MNRAELIGAHVDECVRREPMKRREFARLVREHYEATYPAEHRSIEFSCLPDLIDRLEADEEKVTGFMNNRSNRRLPVELEESIIAALPYARRMRLLIELGERVGVLVVPMPRVGRGVDAEVLGRLSREVGDVFVRWGHVLEDGVIDARDLPEVSGAVTDIDEVVGVLLEMKELLLRKTGAGHDGHDGLDNVVQLAGRE